MSSDPMEKYNEFFALAYQPGALDAKTKHLVALAASLGAGCQPWTEYCLAVARKNGATGEEIDEAVMLAMTVGAHKVRLMAERGLSATAEPPSSEPREEQGEPFTWRP